MREPLVADRLSVTPPATAPTPPSLSAKGLEMHPSWTWSTRGEIWAFGITSFVHYCMASEPTTYARWLRERWTFEHHRNVAMRDWAQEALNTTREICMLNLSRRLR